MDQNLIEITSYHDLTFKDREKVLLAISKPKDFFHTFFNNLKFSQTRTECFNKLNDLHLDAYGDYMYSSYESFMITYKRHLETRRK